MPQSAIGVLCGFCLLGLEVVPTVFYIAAGRLKDFRRPAVFAIFKKYHKKFEAFAKKQFKPENVCVSSFPRRRESSPKIIKYFISITYEKVARFPPTRE
ncbi:hypothetical protein [Neisseria dentiae]|uniref:hypothetical protein n=1 Tax=Neisseria dentiae TaxID=194197 RepID=UPI001301BF09|nr:hypothetical protein [Neisseria dentiae]QMT44651.1 hypothetical protein H3L92_09375 [Neisseria dentiae]